MARYNVDLQDNEGNAYQIMANPDSVAEFSPAVNRENIRSGETYRVIFGKIMKYLSEVGNAAYVGLANNCTTTIAGFALDARQGKELMDRINELNRDLSAMNDNGAITGMDAREDGVYITYVPADGADPVSKKLGSNGITYLGDMPYTCTQDYGDCTLLTFCHQKTATQNVTIKNLNGSYNIKQIVPAHIGGTLCFLAIVDVTSLNKGATIDTESSDTKRVFIIKAKSFYGSTASTSIST